MPISAPTRHTVLIVDDVPENLDVLKDTLKGNYVVRVANSGAVALRIAALDSRPDLILLDIMMPEMDGYEVMRRLRSDPATAAIPVIFLTALTEIHEEVKGLALGACDYITKPINVPIVRARVATQLALRDARRQIEEQNGRLLQERNLIEEIIVRLRDAKGFDDRCLRYLSSSVERTNGDILLATITADGSQWVLVGDIAGHGPAAAMSVPVIANVFYRAARHGAGAGAMLAELNAVMCEKLPTAIYMPYAFAAIAADRARLSLWNGGVPGCAMMTADGHVTAQAPSTLPAGIVATIDFEAQRYTLPFADGDRMYLFTDGLSELPSATGAPLGAAAILAHLVAHRHEPDIAHVRHLLADHHGGEDFPDDMTLVEINRSPGAETPPPFQ